MDISNRIKNALAAFRKQENSTVGYDPSTFLKYGSKRMHQTWSTPEITDQDFYTGYGFAVINKRANRSVVLGKKFLYTDAREEVIARANEEGIRVVHPYLSLIRSSTEFSERDFWYEISTYLDLEGIYYLMAVRTVAANGRVGNIQKFSLLNPYNVRKVVDSKGNVGGYVEERNGMQRQIPAEMIIPIKLLNPFKPNQPYSLADAARDSQFTLKQANDFAREAIDGNLNAPGIISSAIELPDDQFDNFVSRIKNKGRGEPLFGNGAGTISWVDMQTDLDKAALDKINSINRDTLLAISGLSKTGVGVEESGTGREVSRTQKDDFTENAVMPQIENIIDALNLDYRKYYQSEWERNGYTIALDNPLETDRDAEQKDVQIRDSQFKLLQSLEAVGYPYDIAAKYSKGLIDITDIGEVPVTAEDETPTGDGQDPNEPDNSPSENDNVSTNSYEGKSFSMYEGYPIPVLQYLEELSDQINPLSEKGSLIYSTYEPKTVRINKIVEDQDALVALVDEDTFIKLGEFHQNADRIAILTKLNKRYKNQPVAIKKKFELSEEVKVENQVELNVPKYIQDAAARGLELYRQGFGGDGLVDRTIREARLMARGEISEDKVIRANAWGARHAVDLRVPRNSDPQHEDWPGASAVAHYLWGIDPVNPEASRRWFERKAEAIKAERDSSYDYEDDEEMKKKKKKIDEIRVDGHLDHDCDHQVYEIIKNLAFDKQEQLESNTSDLQKSAQAGENRIYDWYVNEISSGNINPRLENTDDFINSLTLPFAVYFTVMWPIYASFRVQQTAKDLNIKDELPVVALTDEVKQKINDFARSEATSHVNTINTDIQNALAIIRSRTSDPNQIKAEFEQAFAAIQQRRAIAIANNAAARIFNISQYDADLQFLTRAGLLNKAYKVLFSLTGDPCAICASIIAQTNSKPIPFTSAFASLGDTIEAGGQKYVFNYEEIVSGNVHPNCRCAYRLVIDDNVA